jgi:NADPH:quinone reductase-like Zn-dependent oxidoreductase
LARTLSSWRTEKAGQTVLIYGGSGGVGHYAIQFAKAKGARVLTTVSTDNVQFARKLGADLIIDYKKQRFEDAASDLDMVFDLIDGETRERSWKLLKKGGILVTTLTDPSQDKAKEHSVRATRYTVEEDGSELAEIALLVTSDKVKPHVQKTYPLLSAVDALASAEEGHSVGKIVMTVG